MGGQSRILHGSLRPAQFPVGQGAGGNEWFADAPKQWINNAFQNCGIAMPKLHPQRAGQFFACTLALSMVRGEVTGHGRTGKEAEANAALEGCRALQLAGMLQRQVSAKQRGKGGSKGKKKGKGQERQAQANLTQVQAGAEPFVLPFKAPVFNGANPAKKTVLMNRGKVNAITLPAAGLEALDRACACDWVAAGMEPAEPQPYHELMVSVGAAQPHGVGRPMLHPLAKRARWSGEAPAGQPPQQQASGVCEPSLPMFSNEAIVHQRSFRDGRLSSDPRVIAILDKRKQLPVFGRRAEVIAATLDAGCTVSVIGGETGSGKTTQVRSNRYVLRS